MTWKILTVVGARPQFIKAAPVGQLDIPAPAYELGVRGGGHGDMTGRMLQALEPVMTKERPSHVLVYGDTNSTLAGALAAAKLNIPIAHVEAGLRSFNRRMPEEINRIVADHLSNILFCPTDLAIENLAREGITRGVHNVGDVMYDAALHAAEQAQVRSDIIERLGLAAGNYAVATLHRAENTDDPARLAELLDFLREQARHRPVVLPVHPRTRKAVSKAGLSLGDIWAIDPVGYLDMHRLLQGAVEPTLARALLPTPPRYPGLWRWTGGSEDRASPRKRIAGAVSLRHWRFACPSAPIWGNRRIGRG
jgi:UDP-GlcNAc3NAcA epimerase